MTGVVGKAVRIGTAVFAGVQTGGTVCVFTLFICCAISEYSISAERYSNSLAAKPIIDRSNMDDNTRASALYHWRLLLLPLGTWRFPCG